MKHTMESLRKRTHDEGDCWVWDGAVAGKGYGVVKDDRERYVHRLVVILDGRTIGAGEQAAHICGRSLCCNPAHIRVGTQSENEADKRAHGTDRRGVPGVTHCGKYLDSGRCKRKPHDGPCKPDIFAETYEEAT